MTGKTHIAGGILASMYFCFGDVTSSALLVIGSLFPDIDHGGSVLGKNIPLIHRFFKHRGFTHSFVFLLITYFLNVWLSIGCCVHIFMDMLTERGVQFLWPFERKFRLPFARFFKTGGWFETFVRFSCYVGIFCLISKHYNLF
jgi:inner membrane protein